MATNVRPINVVDFTGGLNLRGDAFELSPSESPDMLNVDLDGRGGFVARKGWTMCSQMSGNVRTLFVHELSSGVDRIYNVESTFGSLWYSDDGGATWTAISTLEHLTASPHGADFAPWGDVLYVAGGLGLGAWTATALKITAPPAATTLTQAQAATFSPYTAPVAAFPYSQFVAAHSGYMFAAYTKEDGTSYPSRLRWSHPNNPEAWFGSDYIDINEGGGPITGIVPMQDHLLVFKQSSVWALFGYDSDSWQLVNVSREIGAIHRQAIARTETAVFFYAHPHGVYMISNGQTPVEISDSLRPIFDGSDFNGAATNEIWLGWVDKKLWLACPYAPSTVATRAMTNFVFDVSVGDGAWSAYRAADGTAVGPFAQGGFGGGSGVKIAVHGATQCLVKIDDNDLPLDTLRDYPLLTSTPAAFESYYTTAWIDGGFPTLKKSWRRPDFIVKERSEAYELQVDVYRDYDEANVVRDKLITVDAGSSGATWGSFTWGDGTLYGPDARGSRIERGGTLGTARSVQLRLSGQASKPWGVDGIVFKFVPRRMR